ncbi:MAG: sulfatase [Thermoanaerobaculia bacterium]
MKEWWLAAGLILVACGGAVSAPDSVGTSRAAHEYFDVRYQDVVVDAARYGPFDPQIGIHTCDDESRYSLVFADGETRTYTVTLAGAAELYLGGCAEESAGVATGKLEVRAFLPDGRWQDLAVDLAEGWQEARLGLAANGGKVRLQIHAEHSGAERGEGSPGVGRIFVHALGVRAELPVTRTNEARAGGPRKRAILISLDAFREGEIGAIGARTVTPNLDLLLAESERFTPAWSEEISTKPSHASMLTGLPVDVHGTDRGDRPLRPEIETVAERLAAAGASTGAFMEIAPFFAEKFGLNQGFGTYQLSPWSVEQELRVAADWASAHREGDSFLFVHLYGAHSDFGILPYESRGMTRAKIAEKFGVSGYGCDGESCASQRLIAINHGQLPAIPQEREITRYLYDRGVETLDAQLGVFFDDLRRAGLWDGTLIVLTGDHGEQFGEHGYFLHTTPHEETLRVPLLVKWPASARSEAEARRGRITARFSTALDIAPTILADFGLATDDLPGHDLARPSPAHDPLMISKEAVRQGSLKLLFATAEFPRALYDLGTDPGELTNLLPGREVEASRLELLHALAIAAARRLAPGAAGTSQAQPFTAEEEAQLRALGYLR